MVGEESCSNTAAAVRSHTHTLTGLVVDGVVAQDGKQAASLWQMRDQIATAFNSLGTVALVRARVVCGCSRGDNYVALRLAGFMYAYDVSLPLPHMYAWRVLGTCRM